MPSKSTLLSVACPPCRAVSAAAAAMGRMPPATAIDAYRPFVQVWLKPSAEQSFLYGNHVLKAGLGRITEDTPQYQGIVILNMGDVPLGFGTTSKSTAEVSRGRRWCEVAALLRWAQCRHSQLLLPSVPPVAPRRTSETLSLPRPISCHQHPIAASAGAQAGAPGRRGIPPGRRGRIFAGRGDALLT